MIMYANADKSIKIILGRNIVESSFSTIITTQSIYIKNDFRCIITPRLVFLTLFKTFPQNFILPRLENHFSLIQQNPEKSNELL